MTILNQKAKPMAIRTFTTHTCMGLIRDKHIKEVFTTKFEQAKVSTGPLFINVLNLEPPFVPARFNTMGFIISFEDDFKGL